MQNMKPKTLAKRLRNASASAVGTPVFASAFDAQMTSNATSGAPYTRPPFPSLYDPSFEGSGDYAFEHGLVLLNSIDIYQFTLYWHLILIIPVFVMPGVWAVAMLALSTVRSRRITRQRTGNMRGTGSGRRTSWYQSGRRMSWYRSSDSGPHSSMMGTPSVMISRMPAKPFAQASKRVILLAALLIPLVFGAVGAVVAFILSAFWGYALVGIYAVTGFHISTWIPFLWSLLQAVMIIIGSYSLVIDYI